MKKSIVKIVSLMLILVMAIGVLPLTAFADTVAPTAVHTHSYEKTLIGGRYVYDASTHHYEALYRYECNCGLVYESYERTTQNVAHTFGVETCYNDVHSGSTHTYYYKKTCTVCYYVSYRQNTIACDGNHMVEG